jgi:hypothetical protein
VVTASIASGSNLVEVRYSWSNDLGATCQSGGTEIAHTSTLGTETLAPALGETTLYACARDAAGNVATASASYKWEDIAPSGGSWSPASASWNNGAVGVTFTLSGVTDTGGSGLASSNVYSCITGTTNGDTCSVTIYDNAGNSVTLTSPPNNVDDIGPSLAFPGETGANFVTTDTALVAKIKLSPNLAPLVQWRYSLTPFPIDDGTGQSVCTGGAEIDLTGYDFSQPFDLGEVSAGGYTVYSCAEDMAGNIIFQSATH